MSFISHGRGFFERSHKTRASLSALAFAVVFLGAALSSPAVAATPAAPQYTAPAESFMTNLLKDANADHYSPDGNFVIPAIWLYSPEGKLMALANSNADLKKLMQGFPPSKATAPANQPDLATLLVVAAQSAGNKAAPAHATTTGKWTAVFFTTNSSGCNHCARFEHATRQLRDAHAASLDTVTVMLTMP